MLMQAFASLSRAVPRRLSFNGLGLKYLTTAAMGGDAAAEAKFETVKTSVWWDVENCTVPKGCDGHKIAPNLSSALRKMNYTGSLTIYAYGDTNRIPCSVQQALSSTGVSLNHVPAGVKDGSDKKIIVDMLFWAMSNQAPANIMLISGDGDFSYLLHKLRMNGYNIILVRPDASSPFLITAASTISLWSIVAASGSGSGSKVPPSQAEASKQMNLDLGVEEMKSDICKVVGSGYDSKVPPSQAEPIKPMKSDFGVEKLKSTSLFEICKVAGSSSGSKVHPSQAEPSKQMKSDSGVGKKKSPNFCEICKVDCTRLVDFNNHLSGRKHKNKAALVAGQKANCQ